MIIGLDLARWPVRLICTPPALAEMVAARYASFAAPAAEKAWTVEFHAAEVPPEDAQPWPSLLAMKLVLKEDAYLLDAAGIRGRIVPKHQHAFMQYSGPDPLGQLEYFLRIACALFAYDAGGLLVHAAGLGVDGAVYLFIGQSGSGKSTVVSLSPQACALGDDLILLRPDAGEWRAYGTPFWNQAVRERGGETTSGPVRGIYKLIKDRDVYAEALPLSVAVAELLANCPVVNGSAADLPGLVNRCRLLARMIPLRALHFRKDPDFWQVIR